jgi:hypothetical protein
VLDLVVSFEVATLESRISRQPPSELLYEDSHHDKDERGSEPGLGWWCPLCHGCPSEKPLPIVNPAGLLFDGLCQVRLGTDSQIGRGGVAATDSWFTAFRTPGADHAACSASSNSVHERTAP